MHRDVNPATLYNVIQQWESQVTAVLIAMQHLLKPVRANQAINGERPTRSRPGLFERNARAGHLRRPLRIDGNHEELIAAASQARGMPP